jgi:cell division protein FtsB
MRELLRSVKSQSLRGTMRYLGHAKRFDLPVLFSCMILLGYFGWHAYLGPKGFAFRDRLNSQVAALHQDLDATSEKLAGLEKKVKLMRPESVDPDMLDELSRQKLELVRPVDIVVRLD